MRVLLSTGIGSRGDVQPLVALASRLIQAGHQARLCVPPDFRDWLVGLGFPVTPIGPRLRGDGAPARQPGSPVPQGHATGTPPERLGPLAEATVADQFATIAEAARGCDVIVTTALQVAARSVAEALGQRYVFAAFCPAFLPSPHHPPPPLGAPGREQPLPAAANRELWSRHAERFNERFGPALNRHRAAAGLRPGRRRAQPHLHHPPLAGRRPGPRPLARSRSRSGLPARSLEPARRATARPRAGGIPAGRGTARVLRIRQHADAASAWPR